jgi:hypothetical protein
MYPSCILIAADRISACAIHELSNVGRIRVLRLKCRDTATMIVCLILLTNYITRVLALALALNLDKSYSYLLLP